MLALWCHKPEHLGASSSQYSIGYFYNCLTRWCSEQAK